MKPIFKKLEAKLRKREQLTEEEERLIMTAEDDDLSPYLIMIRDHNDPTKETRFAGDGSEIQIS